MHFTIIGETPAKKNSRITLKNGMTIPSKRYQDWHKVALSEILQQAEEPVPIDYPVKITMAFTHGDLRRRDSDNGCSSILDLLTDAKILSDDCWNIVQKIEISNDYSKNSAKCEICIEKI